MHSITKLENFIFFCRHTFRDRLLSSVCIQSETGNFPSGAAGSFVARIGRNGWRLRCETRIPARIWRYADTKHGRTTSIWESFRADFLPRRSWQWLSLSVCRHGCIYSRDYGLSPQFFSVPRSPLTPIALHLRKHGVTAFSPSDPLCAREPRR